MADNKTFEIAFLVSIGIHFAFFLSAPTMSFVLPKERVNETKITYYVIKDAPEKEKNLVKKIEPKAEDLPLIKKEDIARQPRPVGMKPRRAAEDEATLKDTNAIKESVQEKSFESVINEEKDEVKKATYLSYYKAVREKIRKEADESYPERRNLNKGEVFLSFSVASNGELLEVRVVDGKSASDSFLRSIAIDSIRNASPFPPFPSGMNQYQITFNVIISFE